MKRGKSTIVSLDCHCLIVFLSVGVFELPFQNHDRCTNIHWSLLKANELFKSGCLRSLRFESSNEIGYTRMKLYEQIAGDLLPEATPRQRLLSLLIRKAVRILLLTGPKPSARFGSGSPFRALFAITTNTTRFRRATTIASSPFSTMRTRRTTICRLLACPL